MQAFLQDVKPQASRPSAILTGSEDDENAEEDAHEVEGDDGNEGTQWDDGEHYGG